MKRYAIVTFMFDNYDLLREPTVVFVGKNQKVKKFLMHIYFNNKIIQ
jgi:hypothetical protein